MENTNKIRIAVDAMGGDFAPGNEIEGIKLVYDANIEKDLEIVILGDETSIKNKLDSLNFHNKNISIIPTTETITMHDNPVAAVKQKRNSSMIKSIELLKEKKVDGFISAGNTGAMLTTSTLILGRLNGISRPSIGTMLPTTKPYPVLIMDAGATLDLQPRFLYEYAIMGSIYYREVMKIDNPTVGLLNVGEEESKGTSQLIETYNLLKSNPKINFVGNIEGRDILQGKTNLVICDGYTGNVVLKLSESLFYVLKDKMKAYAGSSIIHKIKAGIAAPILKEAVAGFNYEIYGGVPLLGVNGVVIIGHGSSSPVAIKNMIIAAITSIKNNICQKIEMAVNADKNE
ncbi:MAG: phosphate acyltransferase PlsX [Bacteroidetes bacterium]|nr:phosphate acyltransferase PlsX [Bacteroidota bacterium]